MLKGKLLELASTDPGEIERESLRKPYKELLLDVDEAADLKTAEKKPYCAIDVDVRDIP